MAGNGEFNAQQLLDQYVYDYMVKRNLNRTAEIFARDANIDMSGFEEIDSAEGFLSEWWTIFWAAYCSGFPTNPTSSFPNPEAAHMMANNPTAATGSSSNVPQAAPKKPSKVVLGSSSTYLKPNPASSEASLPVPPQEPPKPSSSSEKGSNTTGKTNKKAGNFKPPAPKKSNPPSSSAKTKRSNKPPTPSYHPRMQDHGVVLGLPAQGAPAEVAVEPEATPQQNENLAVEEAVEGGSVDTAEFSDLDIQAMIDGLGF